MDDSYQSAASQPFRVPLDAPAPYRTVFIEPRLHEFAIDLEDPRIAEGLRITFDAIKAMHASFNRKGIPLVVAVLHNKPYLFAPVLEEDRRDLLPRFRRLIRLEERATGHVSRWLSANGIRFVDTGDRMMAEVTSGRMLFAESDDHHPNAIGYGAIAAAVSEVMKGLPR